MSQNSHYNWLTTVVFTLIMSVQCYGSYSFTTDTIPPEITNPAQNETVSCGLVDEDEALRAWYNFAGSMSATDNETSAGNITYVGEPELGEALTLFNLNIICGESRSVNVTFYAVDSCGNRSEPSPATFSSIDNTGPQVTQNAQSQSIACNSNALDSLKSWVRNHGYSEAEDFCGGVQWLRFAYSDNLGNSGTGFLNTDTIPVPQEICNWRLTVSFIAIDDCGNQSVTTGNFSLFDLIAPQFSSLPPDATVSCQELAQGFGITGIDNCDRNPEITIIDTTTQVGDELDCSFYNYSILRTYIVSDDCGNTSSYQQMIDIIDTLPPTFDPPIDTILGCEAAQGANIDLFPTNIMDNCSSINVIFADSIVGTGCEFEIFRTYSVSDVCGNVATVTQQITVIDTIPPDVEDFDRQYIVECNEGNILSLEEYISQINQLIVSDNCGNVNSFVAVPGTYDIQDSSTFPGVFPEINISTICNSSLPGFLLYQEVDFVFYDDCNNAVVLPGVYGIEDNEAPVISSCIGDTVIVGDDQTCTGTFTLPELTVSDNCVSFLPEVKLSGRGEFQSLDESNPNSPVRSVVIELRDFNPMLIDIQEEGTLDIFIDSGDIDEEDEFFTIISETGDSIGVTPISDTECGSAMVSIPISASNVSRWIQDGLVRFLFIPNPAQTIGNICDGGGISLDFSFRNSAVENEVIVLLDGITLTDNDFVAPNTILIPPGNHIVTQIVLDCAGNQDECSFIVSTLDTVAPVITCPSDITISGTTDSCLISVNVPLDLQVTDNCVLNGSYSNTQPSPDNSFLRFFSPGGNIEPTAEDIVLEYTDVSPIIFSEEPVRLFVDIKADINDGGELFEIKGENGVSLGFLGNTGGTECERTTTEFMIPVNQFNEWASDGILVITIDPLTSSDGINPCGTLDENGEDGESFILATLSYNDAILEYKVEGIDTIQRTSLPAGSDSIELLVETGVNLITIYAMDQSGNEDSCSFSVFIADSIAPIARCKPAVLFLDPAGIDALVIAPEDINDGSSDNCAIDSMRVFPDTYSCEDIGTEIEVTLFVYDLSGNVDSCTTQVGIRAPILEPTFELDVCTNDTLRLFANVPPAPIPNAYSFRWTGPFFASFSENPIITSVGGANNGTYTVEVTGFNGCVSTGTVDVNISEVISPTITTQQSEVCRGETILLTSNGLSGNVSYNWYQGIHPDGLLLETTEAPSYLVTPQEEETFYYLIIEQNGCESNPSAAKQVNIIDAPVASVLEEFISVCEGESISIGTNVTGDGYEYNWIGPNQFSSDQQFPDTIFNVVKANEGTYQLTIKIGSCISDTASLLVTVFDRPVTPEIMANQVFCEGSSVGLTVNNIPNAEQYEWYLAGELFSSTSTNTLIIPDASVILNGLWTVTAFDGICYSDTSQPVLISIENELIISANNSGPGCSGDTIELQTSFVPEAVYSWVGPNGFSSDVQNPRIPAIPGEYTITITTSNGCSGEATTTVAIVEPPEITALSSDAPECVNGEMDITFFPSIFPAGDYTYSWVGPNGFTSSDLNPVINSATALNNGTYTLVVEAGVCQSESRSIDIQITDIPAKPSISADNSYCNGDNITLSTTEVSGTPTYIWNTPQGQRSTDLPQLIISDAEVGDGGNYSVLVESGMCRSEESDGVTVGIDNLDFDPVISSNSPICPGDTLKLSAGFLEDIVYQWTGPNGFISSDQNPIVSEVTEDFSGIYRLTVTRGACTIMSADLNVSIVSDVNAPIIETSNQAFCNVSVPNEIEICISTSSSVPNAEYVLYNAETDLEISRSSEICQDIPDINILETGRNEFYFRIDQDGCLSSKSDNILIEVETPPVVDAQVDESNFVYCDNSPVTLTSSFGPPEVTLDWVAISNNLRINRVGQRGVQISNLVLGDNRLELNYSTNLCPDFSSIELNLVREQASILRNDSYRLAGYNSAFLNIFANDDLAQQVDIQIIESPESGELTIDENGATYTPDIRFSGTTFFRYQVCDLNCGNTCQEATVFLRVGDDGDCTTPTIFTPNQDGYNDFFVIPCLTSGNFPENRLTIFNQWGVVVLEQEEYQNDWQGTYNGEDLPVGTYFYIVNLGDGSEPIVGFLTLER